MNMKAEAQSGTEATPAMSGSHKISGRQQFKGLMGSHHWDDAGPPDLFVPLSSGTRAHVHIVCGCLMCGDVWISPATSGESWPSDCLGTQALPISQIRRQSSRNERDLFKDLLPEGVLLGPSPGFSESRPPAELCTVWMDARPLETDPAPDLPASVSGVASLLRGTVATQGGCRLCHRSPTPVPKSLPEPQLQGSSVSAAGTRECEPKGFGVGLG